MEDASEKFSFFTGNDFDSVAWSCVLCVFDLYI